MNSNDNSSGDEDREAYQDSIKPYMFEPLESACESDDTDKSDSDDPAIPIVDTGSRGGRRLKDVSEW